MVSYFYIFLVIVPLMWIISASGACHALAFMSFVLCCWLSTPGTLASFAMYLSSTRSHNTAGICRFTASRIPYSRLEHLHLVGFWPVCSSNIVRIKNRWWQVRCREHKVFYMKLVQNNEAVKYLSFDNQSSSKYSVNRVFIGLADHWHCSNATLCSRSSTIITSPLPVLAQSPWLLRMKRFSLVYVLKGSSTVLRYPFYVL